MVYFRVSEGRRGFSCKESKAESFPGSKKTFQTTKQIPRLEAELVFDSKTYPLLTYMHVLKDSKSTKQCHHLEKYD